MQFRTKLLLVGLAATGALSLLAPPPDEGTVAPGNQRATIAAGQVGKVPAEARRPASLPLREPLREEVGDPFAPHSWQPPPPPPPSPAAPLPPPLKYRYAGAMLVAGELQVFLAAGDRVVPVSAGQDLGDGYRVESISKNEIALRYLPLGSVSTIQIRSTIAASEPAAPLDARESGARAPEAAMAGKGAVTPNPRPGAAEPPPAQLEWKGPPEATLGVEFIVTLRISSRQPIASMPLEVGFDPEDLELVAVRPGSVFPAAESARYFSYTAGTPGAISVAATNPAAVPLSGAELLELTFRPLRNGVMTQVLISALNLQDPAGHKLTNDSVPTLRIALLPYQ